MADLIDTEWVWAKARTLCHLQTTDGEYLGGVSMQASGFDDVRALIKAAPTLLKVLKRLTMLARTTGGFAGPDSELMSACDQAEAAIAAARGESE